MITIIHGEDIVSALKFKDEILAKNKGKEIIDLENPTETDLQQAIESKSLFSNEKIVLISRLARPENFAKIINLSEIPVYLFIEKNLSQKQLSLFPKSQIFQFKPKAIIFEFLDSIHPGNQKTMLLNFNKLADEPELIFYMLIRQFRNLILVKDGSWTSEITPWQKNKYINQANYFTLEKLLDIYKTLEKIDYENKTGQSPLELSKTLELFLLKI